MVQTEYITNITTDTTVDYNTDTYLVDASSGNIVITLPLILSDGMCYLFRRLDNSNNTVTLSSNGSNFIIINGNNQMSATILANTDTLINSYNFNWYLPLFVGQTGPSGINGQTGPLGATGIIGITGAIGKTGPIGETGQMGQTGSSGFSGPTGITGRIGLTGPRPVGSTGRFGNNGIIGVTGPIRGGSSGPVGGITGPISNGFIGNTGQNGQTGMNGPTGQTGSRGAYTYFSASREATTSVTIPTTINGPTGILVPFPSIGPANTYSGTWVLTQLLFNGVTGSTITIPVTGPYLIKYEVLFLNNSGATRIVNTIITVNNTIIPGTGSTVEVPTLHIQPLIGAVILNLNTNDVISVRIIANNTGVTITSSANLFVADTTSAVISLVLL